MDIHRFVSLSNRLAFEDLDWNEAARVGLTDAEKTVLPFFADVESQTVFYMRELFKTRAVREPDTLAFATLWNYEEFFHSYALIKLLQACGVPVTHERVADVRMSARLNAKLEDAFQVMLSRLLPQTFMALYLAWGASQEFMTLRGYEQVAATTQNPVLRELCLRIRDQERRHFAWYFNNAKERLAIVSPLSQKIVREIFERVWTPVGSGVKSKEEIAAMVGTLFPGPVLLEVMRENDRKLGTLPGMEGFNVMERFALEMQPYCRNLAASVPEHGRAVASA